MGINSAWMNMNSGPFGHCGGLGRVGSVVGETR
jgi:hypothetical protein